MYLKTYKAVSPGLRSKTKVKWPVIKKFKALSASLLSSLGRNNTGQIVAFHRRRRYSSLIKYISNYNYIYLPGKLIHIVNDSFHSAPLGLIRYKNGLYGYIILPANLKIGSWINKNYFGSVSEGSLVRLADVEFGQHLYNISWSASGYQQYVRSAGCFAKVIKKHNKFITLKLPSGKNKEFKDTCYANLGIIAKDMHRNLILGKAGNNFHKGRRPVVRGLAMNAVDHPHGGKSGPSRSSVSPWGRPAK